LSQTALIDRALAALAIPHWSRIVELLRVRPRPAGEIAKAGGLNPSAPSRNLQNLKANADQAMRNNVRLTGVMRVVG